MSKTDKELAIDVAKALIEANSVKFGVGPNNVAKQTYGLNLESIQNVIKGVYTTLQNLPEEK
ncbi:hypothetical protein [Carnobacterium mobile]|uniref:hypothetical protein n=1 Tax=Carnobacterium mobile TaxID=2750 RepID=UPI00054D2F9F|nr:hypothetical protein [Carnobacterium mobile]